MLEHPHQLFSKLIAIDYTVLVIESRTTKWAWPPEVGVAQAFEHPILEILATPLLVPEDS